MIENLAEYFESEHEYYLDKISYERIEQDEELEEHSLTCTDNIEAELCGDSVTITVMRTLHFEPEELFSLSVTFGAALRFNEEKRAEYDWQSINLAEEFRMNGQFVLANLMSRISLMISQITSSYGQTPLVLPPQVASKESE